MFIGREQELSELESIWAKEGVRGCSVMGRRQIGKSSLLDVFSVGKHAFTIQFNRGSSGDNLTYFNERVASFLGREIPKKDTLTELFLLLVEGCRDQPTLIVLDEFPYLAEDYPQASSVLQRFIDRDIKGMDVMVVICGSSIRMMKSLVEGMDSPLYGRIDYRIHVGPLSFEECSKFHPNMERIDALKLYMTIGGVPKYHYLVSGHTYKECICDLFLDREVMSQEGAMIITQELSPGGRYLSMVRHISNGAVKQNHIAEKMGMDRGNCKRYLDNLEQIEIISKIHPMLNAPEKPHYTISDPVVDFYFSVVVKWESAIRRKLGPDTIYKMVEHDIDTFLGKRFEFFCGEWLDRVMTVRERGTWWGCVDDVDADIDIVADVITPDLYTHPLLAECKFRKSKMGFSVYNDLVRRGEAARVGYNVRYMLISMSGFDGRLEEFAEDNGVILIGPEELIGDGLSSEGWVRDAMVQLGMRT